MRAGTSVLLVEDDPSIASFVEPELEHLGFRVRCAHDGLSGLNEAGTFGPELVVLDIMLPKLDGVAVLKRLRREGSTVPVIMLTARDSPWTRSTASTSEPTTTSPNRSTSRSSWPASARSFAGRKGTRSFAWQTSR